MLGGSLGMASLFSIGSLATKVFETRFPWVMVIVNRAGCFLIRSVFALADRVRLLTPDMRLLLSTACLDVLTPFSSFALETINAGRTGLTLESKTDILVDTMHGLAQTITGMRLGASNRGNDVELQIDRNIHQ